MKDLGDPIHQSDTSMNYNEIDKNLQGLLDDSPGTTLPWPMHHHNQIPEKKQLKQDSKSQSTPIDNRKKLKQKETDKSFKNGNVIITEYFPQD
ncbi:hypothetical protein RCL_jg8966.t1 [Rhizophagus clarus]|uniref:Uncharacterized protein n=1 Tax=Rhizophagus clarus TaxID=94130 RepID=A0A8H3QD72_9GLOM|nr:hypothetical protein RCL_jg8966.t1 [Rhizophagus clarus]